MALINCPECGKEISDQAAECPNCAYPIFQWVTPTSTPTPTPTTTPHVTVEETKKKFKLTALIASIVFILGVFVIFIGGFTYTSLITGTVLCALSFFTLIINSALRWWHHG